jgi:hypothetical protein
MRALRIAVLAAAGVLTAMFVYVVAARIGFPYELEWMCGSVLDHVARVRAGLPVYAPPTTSWIPFLYPPLFYWVAAPFGGGFLACRLISLAAALVQAACIWRVARSEGAGRYWSTLGVLLFFSCYFYVGYWYDIERSDTLCTALILVASVVTLERRTARGALTAGAIFGVAFFAKQQALPFAVAAAVGLAVDHAWKRGVLLAGATTAIVVTGTVVENAETGGWFGVYIFKMPATHGIDVRLWRDVLDYDVPRGCVLILATLAFLGSAGWRAWQGDRRPLVLASLVAAGGATALSSRLHVGGWINVLQTWTSLACPATAILGARLEMDLDGRRFARAGSALFCALLLVQLALWVHPPSERVPDGAMRADTKRFLAGVSRLERNGDVLVVGRGHVTAQTHFQMSALADVARIAGAPRDLLDVLRLRGLAAIVDDARIAGAPELGLWPPIMLEDIPDVRAALFADYYVAERFDDASLRIPMPAPAMPRWVYRPRRTPLVLDDAELARRHFAEMDLAERRSNATRTGVSVPYTEDDIEELAARASASSH